MFLVKKGKNFSKIIFSLFLICLVCWTLQFVCFAEADKVVKIGLLTSYTGPLAANGVESVRGAKLAFKEINAAGGINGYKFELLTADAKNREPDVVLSATLNLLNSDVDCIIGACTSRDNFEINTIAEKNIPYILTSEPNETRDIIEPNPEKYPTVWSLAASYEAYQTQPPKALEGWISKGLFDPGERKFAVICNDVPYSKDIATGMKKILIEKYGWTCVLDEMIPLSDVYDWRPIWTKLRHFKPNLVVNTDFVVGNAVIFIKQFNEDPFNTLIFIQYAPVLQEFIDLTKEYSTGVLYSMIGGSIPSPKAEKAVELLNKYVKEYGQKPSGVYADYVYEAVNVYADALRKVGDPKEYLEIGKAIEKTDKEISMGRLVFDKKTHLAILDDEYIPFQMSQLWDGERCLIYTEKYAVADFRLPPWFK